MEASSESGLNFKPLPRVGQELGRFLIEKELPRGGQARVYRAWQLDLQRPVALKLLPSSFATDEASLQRFRREIENVARISHPNVVHVYEAGEMDGHAFFTMEFIEGDSAEQTARKGPLGPDEAAALLEAVARGVQAAHSSGIIHRDIKPGNILLRRDGTPVLTDFGLAQDLRHSHQLTQTGVSMGTPAYMAPEQARGERQRVGKRSDVYALGATLYTLLTGRRPAEGDSAYELMMKVADSAGPRWSRADTEHVPQDLRAIVELAMQNDPGKRYESAEALADDLERFLHGEWVVARARSGLSRLYARGRRYIPAAAVLLLAAALATALVVSGLNLPDQDPALGRLLDDRDLTAPIEQMNEGDIEQLFAEEGQWIKSGALVRRGAGDELILVADGEGPIYIAPRDPTCWGDFTLQTQLNINEATGPLTLLIGTDSLGTTQQTAYALVLGAEAEDQLVLLRAGVPVFSTVRAGNLPLLVPGRWYNAAVSRRALSISFQLTDLLTGQVVTGFEFEDDFPALDVAQGVDHRRYGVRAHVAQLSVRNVTVSHRDHRHETEDLLFAFGLYGEAALRLGARPTDVPARDAPPAQRNEFARRLFLRARCRLQMGDTDGALADAAQAREVATEPMLRARSFLFSARQYSARGDDEAALVHLRAARLQAIAPAIQSRVFHEAANLGHALRATEPLRALEYFDYVANNALGTPSLVASSLLAAAEIRLADPASRGAALEALQRVSGSGYRRYSASHPRGLALLFEARWSELLARTESADAAATDELRALGAQMSDALPGYGVDRPLLTPWLARAAWLARAGSDDTAANWLRALAQGGDSWARIHLALLLEEQPAPSLAEARIAAWRTLALEVGVNDPAFGVASTLADYFLYTPTDPADARRRNDLMRRNLLRELQGAPSHWLGDASPDRFVDYCQALYEVARDRAGALAMLQTAAAAPDAGALRFLLPAWSARLATGRD